MESNKILQADVLDIIFEQKNKQYGAYELRKNYHKRARKAVMITATIAMVAVTVPLIAALLNNDDIIRTKPYETTVIIPNVDPIKPVVPPKEPEAVQPVTKTKLEVFVEPEIEVAEKVKEDEILKPQEDLSKTNFGAEKQDGKEEGPVALNPVPGKEKPGEPVVEVIQPKESTHDIKDLEQLPEFPGGEDAMITFLKNNLKYPKRAQDEGENGKVVLEFVVDKDGKISEIDFLRKAGYGFDDEAKRVMNMMPDWKPGKINGQPVKARYQIPILFEIED